MIGPLIRSPRHVPRTSPLVPGRRRRLENLASHAIEILSGPFGLWSLKRLAVERRDVSLQGLGRGFDGYRVAFLSDLHYSAVVPKSWIARAVAAALALEPDLILLGGDYLSHSARYAPGLVDLLRPLAAPDGVFGVLGNHDHYVGAAVVRDALDRAGVVELRNRPVAIRRGADALAVAGVGDLRFDVIDFDAAVAGVPERVPRIVVSHDPDVFAFWPAERRLDLMLSGHTHGGQAHLPWLGPPYVPSQFGFRYLAGAVREAGRQLYVSRGLGAITAPIRWGCPPEITLLVLRPS
ncbi:MAG TPA: metallophosphoesterase [Gemmatimonadales bacterium]|nr:metallophosphoesterase [Gemmatimonadales bacterium]